MAKKAKQENKEITTTSVVKDTYISVRKKQWVDLQDNNYPYKQGDIYPRAGLEVSDERIKELSGIHNKLGEVLIQKVEVETDRDKQQENNTDETDDKDLEDTDEILNTSEESKKEVDNEE